MSDHTSGPDRSDQAVRVDRSGHPARTEGAGQASPGPSAPSGPSAQSVPDVIVTSPVTPSVDAARRVLAAALDADLPGADLPGADLPGADPAAPPVAGPRLDPDRFTVAEALAVLDDVTPPYPPLPQRLDPVPSAVARREALVHLEAALDEAGSVRDLTRIGLAALVLRRGGGVVA